MDGGAWWAAVHGVAKSQTRLNDFTFNFHFHALEEEIATHSSILSWRIPATEEPVGLPSMGSDGVGHDWRDLAAAAAAHNHMYIKSTQEFCIEFLSTLFIFSINILVISSLHYKFPSEFNEA